MDLVKEKTLFIMEIIKDGIELYGDLLDYVRNIEKRI